MKLLTILLTLLLLPVSATFGQAIDETVVYGGLKYDQNAYVSASGVGFKMGKGLWGFVSAGPANDGAEAALEAVYFIDKGRFSFGSILGPNFDWVDYPTDSLNPVMYFLGAVGTIVAYELTDDIGVWAAVKQKWTFGDNSYNPNTQLGGGLYLKVW